MTKRNLNPNACYVTSRATGTVWQIVMLRKHKSYYEVHFVTFGGNMESVPIFSGSNYRFLYTPALIRDLKLLE